MTTFIVIPSSTTAGSRTGGLIRPVARSAAHHAQLDSHRQLLNQTLDDSTIAGRLRSVEGRAPATPWRGSRAGRTRPPRSLDALGAILVDDLSRQEIDRLKAAGAAVIENVKIQGHDPIVATSVSTSLPSRLWHLEKIGVTPYHNRGLKGAGITVGVLDSGIDAAHPEFLGKAIHFAAFDTGGVHRPLAAMDYGTHGTHVSGILAGRKIGVAPEASLAVAAVMTENGGTVGYLAQILAGLNWLIQTQFPTAIVSLINASIGKLGYDGYALDAISNARDLFGVSVMAAIGNSGPTENQHHSPGNYNCVMGVGATDERDQIAQFSSFGTVPEHGGIRKPDLCAPGVAIISALPGGRYGAADGTSMATPVVTGLSALLVQEDTALLDAPDVLRDAIFGRTVPLPDIVRAGHGRVQL